MRPDTTDIDLQIADLRARLEDAEELRRAICDGEVDALVIGREEEKVHVLVPHAQEEEAAATLSAIHRGEVDAFVIAGERVVTLSSALHPYQLLADRMQQGAVTTTADGTVVYVNERFSASMMRAPRRNLVGKPLTGMVMQADRAALVTRSPRKGATQLEVRLLADDGSILHTLASATALGAGQTMWLFSDVSLQKRHEATDERTRKFLGMLAHEFRGMLATISYSAAFLKDAQVTDEKARDAVDAIERQTKRLSGLVDDLRSVNPKE